MDADGNAEITEDERVESWRVLQFLALGFDVDEALTLATSDADLHVADNLLAHGCSIQTALHILL